MANQKTGVDVIVNGKVASNGEGTNSSSEEACRASRRESHASNEEASSEDSVVADGTCVMDVSCGALMDGDGGSVDGAADEDEEGVAGGGGVGAWGNEKENMLTV